MIVIINSNTSKKPSFLKRFFHKREDIEEHFSQVCAEQDNPLDYFISYVENQPDLILVLSLEGKVISYNRDKINEYLGYKPEQKIQLKEIVSEEDYDVLISTFHKTLEGKSKRVEIQALSKQGEQLEVIGRFTPIVDASKNIAGVFFTIESIKVPEYLHESELLKAVRSEQAQKVTGIGSWEYLISEDEIKFSESCCKIFDLKDLEDKSLNTFISIVHPQDFEEVNALMTEAIKNGTSYSTEFRLHREDTNELRYVKVNVEVEEKDHKPTKLIGLVRDTTERKKLDALLLGTINDYRYVFDHLDAGIWKGKSIDSELRFASKGIANIFQISLEKIYANPGYWKDMVLQEDREELLEKYKLLEQGERIEHEYRIKDGNGVMKWIYEQTIPKINEFGEVTHLFGMVTDISEEKEMRQKLEFLAGNDALTALPNQYSLHERIDELIESKDTEHFALLNVNLDGFHWINDHLGYQIGERVLKKIANRLIEILSRKDYLAKAGNDAFVFVIQDYNNKDVVFEFAEKVIEIIKNQIVVEGYELHVTTSIGIGFYPDSGDSKLVLLENAETALYHAKHQGKNNYQIYSFDSDIESHKRYILERDLLQAIQDEDFEVYYQPQVNPKDDKVEGAEALIRWNHKEWGIIPPNEFILIAEEQHLIHHIENWVIEAVFKQLQTWKNQGYKLFPIAINISPIRFLKADVVDEIKKRLNEYQIDPKYIELEITENSLLKNEKTVVAALKELKELGIRIAIDDFGTGFSSFHYLQNFDLDTLKIDKMFIDNLNVVNGKDSKEATIVSSLLYLAKGLKMKVVAEGIEEFEQLEFLKQEECDSIQGYLYSRPVPASEFEEIIRSGYLKPKKLEEPINELTERRKYFRFDFPSHVIAKMNITAVNKQKVNLASAVILIENISLDGMRFLTTLSLPVNPNIKLNYQFKLMNENFQLSGSLIYLNHEKADTYSYGVSFDISEMEEKRLAEVINKMTISKRDKTEIPDTDFINESPYTFLRKKASFNHTEN